MDAVHARHLGAVWSGRHRRRLRRSLQPGGRDLRRRPLSARGRRLPPPARCDLLLQPLSGIRRIGAVARPPGRQLPELGDRHAHRPRRRARADHRRPPGSGDGGRAGGASGGGRHWRLGRRFELPGGGKRWRRLLQCHRGSGARRSASDAGRRGSAGERQHPVGRGGSCQHRGDCRRGGRRGTDGSCRLRGASRRHPRLDARTVATGRGGPCAGRRQRTRQTLAAGRAARQSRRAGGGGGGRSHRAPRALPRVGALPGAARHLRGRLHLRRPWQHRPSLPSLSPVAQAPYRGIVGNPSPLRPRLPGTSRR